MLRKSNLAKNSAKLLSSNIVAQAIGFCVYPLLTRLYSPDDFGLLNLFLSIGGVLLLLATGEYYSAIVLPKTQSESNACFHVGMLCNLLVTTVCVLSFPFASQIASLFNAPNLLSWYFLLPFYVFLSASWQLLNYWYVRLVQFNRVSAYQLIHSSLNAGFKYVFGRGGCTQGGLLVSTVISPFIALSSLVVTSYSMCKQLLKINWQQVKKMAVTYRYFPCYTLPKALVNYVGGNLPVLLLAPFFSLTDIGFLGMALALSHVPINQVSKSFYQVFFEYTSRKVNQNEPIWYFFRRFLWIVGVTVLLVFALLYWILPPLVVWLLGNEWADVVPYIKALMPWLAMVCMYAPIDFVMDIFGKQDKQFYFEVALLIIRSIAMIMGICQGSFFLSVLYYSIGSALLRLLYVWYQCTIIKEYENSHSSALNRK